MISLLLAMARAEDTGIEAYLARRLEVVEVQGTTFYAKDYDGTGVHWLVRQGGQPLRADQLAGALGDEALARKLKRRRRAATWVAVGGMAAGGSLVVVGFVVAPPLSGVGAAGILGGVLGLDRVKTSAHPSWVWSREAAEVAVARFNEGLAGELLTD